MKPPKPWLNYAGRTHASTQRQPPRGTSPELSQQSLAAVTKCQLTDTLSGPKASHQSQLKSFPVSNLGKQGRSSCSSCSDDFHWLHYSELPTDAVSPIAQFTGANYF